MEKFTKGPWQYTSCGPADSDGMGICAMWGDPESEKETMNANSHLIAAAPDMYEMLKSIANAREVKVDGSADKIRDLLAKARGEA